MNDQPKRNRFVMAVIEVLYTAYDENDNPWYIHDFILREHLDEPSKGLLSNIVGKVQGHEDVWNAVVRETHAQTGIETHETDWTLIGGISGDSHNGALPGQEGPWSMVFFHTVLDFEKQRNVLNPIFAAYPLQDDAGEIDRTELSNKDFDMLPEYYEEMDRVSYILLSAVLSNLSNTVLSLGNMVYVEPK